MNRAGRRRRLRALALLSAPGAVLLVMAGLGAAGGTAAAAPARAAAPPTASDCSTAASGVTTCRNTGPFAHAWNPATRRPAPVPREASVSQTSNLTSQVVDVSWKYLSPSDGVYVGGSTAYPVEVLECQTAAPTSISQCFGSLKYPHSPVQSDTNFKQAVTGPDSTQSIQFGVLSKAEEPSLGCDQGHPCSLLVLPWAGGKQPVSPSSAGGCLDHSQDGVPYNNKMVADWDTSVCAWDSRIVVPLQFAATPDNCGAGEAQFAAQGSPLDARAMDLWRTGLCGGSTPLNIGYTDLGEYQARGDVGLGAADMALTTQPADLSGRPVTYAPVTNTAMVVSYYVDDPKTGRPIATPLRLNARLLAKMLTQSYEVLTNSNCAIAGHFPCDPEVKGNPRSLFADPEFKDLNKDLTSLPGLAYGQNFPTVVFGDNDTTHEITRWIASDVAAAGFLRGNPAPGPMRINTAYLPANVGTLYPTSAFNPNDPGSTVRTPGAGAGCGKAEICVAQGMQLMWNPVNGLHNVAIQQLLGKSSARVALPDCPAVVGMKVCDQHPSQPPDPLGKRGVFAITAASDAAAYQFPTAQLQTGPDTFVGPTPEALSAAVNDMKTAPNGVASLDYRSSKDPAAYPLTMPTYAMLPTCGLTSSKITAITSFLRYVASAAGQHSGLAAGDLAPGYLPLTAAQRSQTLAAVSKLSTRACPALTPAQIQALQDSANGATSQPSNFTGTGSGPGPGSSPAGAGTGRAPGSGKPEPQHGAPGETKPTAFGPIKATKAGFGGIVLPLLLGLGLLFLLGGGPLAYLASTGRSVSVRQLRASLTRAGAWIPAMRWRRWVTRGR